MCGEQPIPLCFVYKLIGSPPRVRGTAVCDDDFHYIGRITPACVGNSFASELAAAQTEDHPRVCGEQRAMHGGMTLVIGSPPRVRGTGR